MSRWASTGFVHEVPTGIDRVPPFDPRSGDHLWVICTAYRWGGPTVETPHLDMESLLSISGPGCYYCEREYTPLLAARRCPGRP